MFSPAVQEATGPAKATRSNNRRRQRPLSSDSLAQQPKAKRQRLPLTETTFVNPDNGSSTEMLEIKQPATNGYNRGLGQETDGVENFGTQPAQPRRELSLRSKKAKAGDRVNKGDGSVVLTTNSAYTVSKLPALPDRVKAEWSNRQRGTIFSSAGFGLSLTHTHAYVWPYAATTSSPETFVFTLPYPARLASDPLPLGCLVSPSATSEEPGLVVVMPVSGKISYWESISAAATLDFLQKQRTGVEDSIYGMHSSEQVTEIINAEPAGFVLAFTSGRLAYMSVRDAQGRPAISTQFMRSGFTSAQPTGFFGSIRHVLTSSAHQFNNITVKANPSSIGSNRVVVASTTQGKFQAWRIHRGGHHDDLLEVDAAAAIAKAVRAVPSIARLQTDQIGVLDFVFVPRDVEDKYTEMSTLSGALEANDETRPHLLALLWLRPKSGGAENYALLELQVASETATTGVVRLLHVSPSGPNKKFRPRLQLPRPGLLAFAIFERSIVVTSLATKPLLPDEQLQLESSKTTTKSNFEDVVDFKDRDGLEIVGSGAEEPAGVGYSGEEARFPRHKSRQTAVVVLVQGVGVVRVAINDIDRFGSDSPPKVTPEGQLEQAVFFGFKDGNPLKFAGRKLDFPSISYGKAAVLVSRSILSSESKYITNASASVETNLRTRLGYLENLLSQLKAMNLQPEASDSFKLLDDASAMSTAAWIWRQHEAFMADRSSASSAEKKRSIVTDIVTYISESQKKETNPTKGEVDRVRHWFNHDIWRIHIFVAWAGEFVKLNIRNDLRDKALVNRALYEAVVLSSGAVAEAFKYRAEHAEFYGIDEKGKGLPAPWTASHMIGASFRGLIESCFGWLDTYWPPAKKSVDDSMDGALIERIRDLLPDLISCYFTVLGEAANAPSESTFREYGQQAKKHLVADSYTMILKLRDYDLTEEAIRLAEQFHSFEAMAELMVMDLLELRAEAARGTLPPSKLREVEGLVDVAQERIGDFFDRFGDDFAFPAYDVLLAYGSVQDVLDFPCDRQGFKTRYLQTKPEYARISWINDVETEKDIGHAADTLLELGYGAEQRVWSKKIELSLGKLALLAEGEAGNSSNGKGKGKEVEIKHEDGAESGVGPATERKILQADAALEVIEIQDRLYKQIMPTISEAVDLEAAITLAVDAYGVKIPKKAKVMRQLFVDAMARLLKHEALDPRSLVDLLSLIALPPEHVLAIRDQFFLALRVAELALEGEELENLRRMVWRRCYIRDDWQEVNDTVSKDDDAQLEVIGLTGTYRAMWSVAEFHKSDPTFYPLVKPSDCLGVYTDALDPRFDNMDEGYRNHILEAIRAEDKVLKAYIDNARLDHWYDATLDAAERTVARDLDLATMRGADGELEQREIEAEEVEEQETQEEEAAQHEGVANEEGLRRSSRTKSRRKVQNGHGHGKGKEVMRSVEGSQQEAGYV